MSMSVEQQEKLLLGLRTEVLELKEILADEYYDKSQISDFNYVSNSELENSLSDYYTKSQVINKYETIKKSEDDDNSIKSELDNFVNKSQLDNYVDMETLSNAISIIDDELLSIKKMISDNNDFVRNEDLPSKTSQLLNDSGYLTKSDIDDIYMSSLSTYVTKSYFERNVEQFVTEYDVESIISNKMNTYVKDYELVGYANKSDVEHLYKHVLSQNDKISNIESVISSFVIKDDMNEFEDSFIKKDVLDSYVSKNELISYMKNSMSIYTNDIYNKILSNINEYDYITRDEIALYNQDLSSYAKKSDLNTINSEISELTMDVLNNVGNIETLNQTIELNYYDKSDIDSKLSLLKNIGSCVYLNDEYKDRKDDFLNEIYFMDNGLYVVEDSVYFVYGGKILNLQ